MQIGFICPDGQRITHDACLAHCRMNRRCAAKPTLRAMARTRPWTGTPSVTQCIKGTTQAFLEIVTDYYVSPQDCAFMLSGTQHHSLLEQYAEGELAEEAFKESITGIPDLLDLDEDDSSQDHFVLWDYKQAGSYKVCLLFAQYLHQRPVVDEAGNPALYKSGPRKGQPKHEPKLCFPVHGYPSIPTEDDYSWQVNKYRLMYQGAGFYVTKQRLQITVRDGGLYIATQRGVTDKIYVADVPIIPDAEVNAYFDRKAAQLCESVACGSCQYPCTAHERWDGDMRCKRFCNVAHVCEHGRQYAGASMEDEA